MTEFYYLISFYIEDEHLRLNIELEAENMLIPVFMQSYNQHIIDNKEIINGIFMQISDYFSNTSIKMTKSDFILFYNTFKTHELTLPNVASINIIKSRTFSTSMLTPKEILFLLYIDGKSVDAKKARYWLEEYNLDIDYTISYLMELNYITTNDYLFNVSKATKKELAIVLDRHQINYSGNKKDVYKKVMESFSNEELELCFSGLYYRLTNKGNEITKNHLCLNEFHKSYYRYANGLRIEEFFILNRKFINLDAKDVCKMMVDSKNNEPINDFDWDKFYNSENKVEVDFVDIISKYPNNTVVQANEVTDEEFLHVVNKTEKEEKINQHVFDEEFLNIINRTEKRAKEKQHAIDEEFLNIVFKTKNKVKNDKIDDKQVVEIDCNEKTNDLQVLEYGKNLINVRPLVKRKNTNNVLMVIFKRFIYSSALVSIIIYSLYNFVLK